MAENESFDTGKAIRLKVAVLDEGFWKPREARDRASPGTSKQGVLHVSN